MKLIVAAFLLFFAPLAIAVVPVWTIIPEQSSLSFTGTQNDAPVSGEFKKFSGDIKFDEQQLDASSVHIVVDMNSLKTSYSDLTDTLVTSPWFDSKLFPQAEFDAQHFKKLQGNHYQADGTLKIRDKSVPVVLSFTVEKMTATDATVKGSTQLKRLQFGVGQGEWASTKEVKDDVKVEFVVNAKKG